MRPAQLPIQSGYESRRFDYDRPKTLTFNARPRFEYEQRRNYEYQRPSPFNNRTKFDQPRFPRTNYSAREYNGNWNAHKSRNANGRYVNPLVAIERKNYETKN